jgi:hypothetical protein
LSGNPDRIRVGDVVFLRGRVTDIDRGHPGAPIAIETVGPNGQPTDASLVHWVRPDHLVTVAEARAAARK